MLHGKNILLGVCGSIAAYKAAPLIRLLIKANANVKVVMTKDATNFITPLTLSTLSKNPVLVGYSRPETGEWNNHVELALWADIMLIAPASANTLAKMATGLCNNLLMAVYISAKCPVYVAPAMDLDMWKHPATVQNIAALQSFGHTLIRPQSGELASGLVGEGRLAEPEDIIAFLSADLRKNLPLADISVLITAGPTFEAIDPVRFIGNHSSGKMGFAIADKMATLGANVILVTGPTAVQSHHNSITRIDVTSAAQMLEQCEIHFKNCSICIMSAAIADYTPVTVSTQKIKKQTGELTIELKKTIDVLKMLGSIKQPGQLLVGFALETDNEESNAVEKLKSKNLDFIVLNSLKDEGAGFQTDTNKITIIDRDLGVTTFALKDKAEVAADICQKVLSMLTL
jgi:phosphopantothenoylcysteine decarboxylase/phosphopantothenate--cysteine ligase